MKIVQFPRWAEVLSHAEIPDRTREAYRITIRWYLSWCGRHSTGCTVASAREFIEWAKGEKNASEWMVERWREAIRWFFINARKQCVGVEVSQEMGQDDAAAVRPVKNNPKVSAGPSRRPATAKPKENGDSGNVRRGSANETGAERIEARNDEEQKPQERGNDADLFTCDAQTGCGRAQSPGSLVDGF